MYSNSIKDHKRDLEAMFHILRDVQLYLKAEKCDLYSKCMDCLGHIIDDQGLHADRDKMARI